MKRKKIDGYIKKLRLWSIWEVNIKVKLYIYFFSCCIVSREVLRSGASSSKKKYAGLRAQWLCLYSCAVGDRECKPRGGNGGYGGTTTRAHESYGGRTATASSQSAAELRAVFYRAHTIRFLLCRVTTFFLFSTIFRVRDYSSLFLHNKIFFSQYI